MSSRYGEVSEWLKEHAWKVCIQEIVSRVRIPPSPPYLKHTKPLNSLKNSGVLWFLGSEKVIVGRYMMGQSWDRAEIKGGNAKDVVHDDAT
ncbi:hypothetical protein ALQ57_101732 [Pseudomonas amygdali pv. hibisci]|uniref:Uncharacterized protein n=4 Tax=Pseudomonas amygdali TaxID=47877 RepID=A0AAX1VZS3_PSEAJ|nr:hypothetical protein ALO67_101707 [Pseudomonas amygdali pv. hibisci]KPY77516.1 hypothetical protein ALO60_101741 [Pseudomonas amygdali pv. tabaci]RMM34907.1 hypothetical protein ALQ79_02973 [Pseudomonas amygdali pv. lachrymans]RML83254.1 hypothetical protein ALQ89_100546 [Pseudomonas amygdali pv. tabaci]RMN54673.1 hypothetical protein ALQ57_101732 [Pseudomonas amygdali pv. hibisci]